MCAWQPRKLWSELWGNNPYFGVFNLKQNVNDSRAAFLQLPILSFLTSAFPSDTVAPSSFQSLLKTSISSCSSHPLYVSHDQSVPPVSISSLCYPSCLFPLPFLHGSWDWRAKSPNPPEPSCSFLLTSVIASGNNLMTCEIQDKRTCVLSSFLPAEMSLI